MADIFQAQDEHWPLVREIRLRSLSSDPRAFGQTWEKESTYDEARWRERVQEAAWFLATEDDTPVGVVASRHEHDSPETERELQAMWVTPASRKSGIAQMLAEAVLDWARGDGAESVTLYVGPENEPARRLYDALGFTDTGDRWVIDDDEPESAWTKMSRAL
ncbi:GNAT family N-acetyltransferase [Brachybacterium huguangmaarense]